jgi:hypothetical protein
MANSDKNETLKIEEADDQIHHGPMIEEVDSRADLDVGVKALQGQELNFTEEGISSSSRNST